MTFVDKLKSKTTSSTEIIKEDVETKIEEQKKLPEDILRSAGYKLKLVHQTKFGTQIDFFKNFDQEEIKEVLKEFSLKFDGKSVFVID